MNQQQWAAWLDSHYAPESFEREWYMRMLGDWERQIELMETLMGSLSRKVDVQNKQLNAIRALIS